MILSATVSILIALLATSCSANRGNSKVYERHYRLAEQRSIQTDTTPFSRLNSYIETGLGVHGAFTPDVPTSRRPMISPEVSARWLFKVPQVGHIGPEVTYRGTRGIAPTGSTSSDNLWTTGLTLGGYSGEVGKHITLGSISSIGYIGSSSHRVIDGKEVVQGSHGAYVRLGICSLLRISGTPSSIGLEVGITGYYLKGRGQTFSSQPTPGLGWFPSLTLIHSFGSL